MNWAEGTNGWGGAHLNSQVAELVRRLGVIPLWDMVQTHNKMWQLIQVRFLSWLQTISSQWLLSRHSVQTYRGEKLPSRGWETRAGASISEMNEQLELVRWRNGRRTPLRLKQSLKYKQTIQLTVWIIGSIPILTTNNLNVVQEYPFSEDKQRG